MPTSNTSTISSLLKVVCLSVFPLPSEFYHCIPVFSQDIHGRQQRGSECINDQEGKKFKWYENFNPIINKWN